MKIENWKLKIGNNKESIYSFFVYLTVFLSSVFPYADKDWGWHYKYGEYLIKHGQILREDIFSWTLPGYQWINHSWLFDPLLYILSHFSGHLGLSIAGAFMNLLAFYFIIATFRLSYWQKAILAVPFLLIGEAGIEYGLRSQVISTLFLSILLYLLIRARDNHKFLYPLPVLFLFWVNFHGYFTAGLGITAVFLGFYSIEEFYKTKKVNIRLLMVYSAVAVLSFAATFINPFGYGVYLESLRHLSNPYLKNVYEWMPIYDNCSYCHPATFFLYLGILIGAFGLAIKRRSLFAIPFFILCAILLWPTIETRRLLPVFVVVTLPFLAYTLNKFKWEPEKYKTTNLLAILIFAILLQFNFYNRFTKYNLYSFKEADFTRFNYGTSLEGVDYLTKNPPKGRGFNFYDWGGYMIGKGVPAKLFVDGRMHLWQKDGYQPFADYIRIYYENDFELFKKYDFDWVFIANDSFLSKKLLSSQELGIWKLEYQNGKTLYFVRVRTREKE